jgi:phytoene dehydrogenase-like protein
MAATLLAKRGMNVLVLDDENETEPLPNLLTGLGSRSFKSLLGKLMIPDTKLQVFHENKVACQVVLPRHRLDLHRSRPLFLKEVDREFPGEREIVEELLAEIDVLRENHLDELLSFFPVLGPKEKKRFIRWVQALPGEKALSLWSHLSAELQCVFKAQIRFLSRSPLIDPPLFQLLLFLPPEASGSFSIRGGAREVKKLFFDKLDYFGGMVHPLGEEPFTFATRRSEIKAVQLPRYNFPTRCRFVLGNLNIQTLYRSLPTPLFSFLTGRGQKKIADLQPTEKKGLFQYEVPRDILPGPMKENLIYIDDPAAPLEGANYLELNVNPPSRAVAPEADTLMTASYTLGDKETEEFETLHARIDERLHRLIPFADSRLRRVFPAVQVAAEAVGETSPLFPPQDETAVLEKILRKRVSYAPSFFFPAITSPFKNLFVLGPNVLDWLGLEGKMLGALRAVEMIWAGELKVRNS